MNSLFACSCSSYNIYTIFLVYKIFLVPNMANLFEIIISHQFLIRSLNGLNIHWKIPFSSWLVYNLNIYNVLVCGISLYYESKVNVACLFFYIIRYVSLARPMIIIRICKFKVYEVKINESE